jgi:hypothetical protein
MDFQINASGELEIVDGSQGLQQMLVFTSNSTFTKATFPEAAHLRIRAIGGGGGSAGSPLSSAGQVIGQSGGSSGSYSESVVNVSSLAASETITVGAGGAAGVSGFGSGGTGGQSSFGSIVTAPGGLGSSQEMNDLGPNPTVTTPTQAGVLGVGQIRVRGHIGQSAIRHSNTVISGGTGGGSVIGADVAAGTAGRDYGGGAGGSVTSTGAVPGFAGAAGVVIVEIYN